VENYQTEEDHHISPSGNVVHTPGYKGHETGHNVTQTNKNTQKPGIQYNNT
jgi:hypothetical protein